MARAISPQYEKLHRAHTHRIPHRGVVTRGFALLYVLPVSLAVALRPIFDLLSLTAAERHPGQSAIQVLLLFNSEEHIRLRHFSGVRGRCVHAETRLLMVQWQVL
jgi:hypothetical protein